MLVLSRKLNERIIIGEVIHVTAVKIDQNQIRLGIEAARHGPVFWGEIFSLNGEGLSSSASRKALWSTPRISRSNATNSESNRPPFSGWHVLFTTPFVTHPFIRCVLKEIANRFPGILVASEYHPRLHALDVIPPRGTEIAESDRVGVEIEALQGEIHRAMQREAADDAFQDYAI
jgi:carbon storage regulator CsrA